MVSPSRSQLVAPIVVDHYADLDRLGDAIAPPYDVIAEPERAQLAARSANNIVHLILPQGNGDRYVNAARRLAEWRASRVLARDSEPAAFVLSQEFTTPDGLRHVRTGLLAGVAVEQYAGGRIRPHEKTHAEPKADRLSLLRATGTMLESLFFLAPDDAGDLGAALATVTNGEPWARAALAGVQLTLWRVTGAGGTALTGATGDTLYIADGHHRFETAVAYAGENPRASRTLGLIVPRGDRGLVVLATHRLIHGAAISRDRALAAFRKDFEVEVVEPEFDPAAMLAGGKRGVTTCMVVLPSGALLRLSLRDDADVSAAGTGRAGALDVARVDALVVARLRELAGPRAAVTYSAFPGEVVGQVGAGRAAAAVMLAPTRVDEVISVADAGEFMPQKSTYFVPKVPSGLLLLPL